MIDRNNRFDSEKCISALLPQRNKKIILSFLGQVIEIANRFNNNNWNVNLDLQGKFLRFNVGQEYCFEIRQAEVLILCLRTKLPKEIKKRRNSIAYLGYYKKKPIKSMISSEVPDCLVKVPNSIGCIIKDEFNYYLDVLKNSNYEFIKYAISHTKILPKMVKAHSVGSIIFLSDFLNKEIPNPSFVLESIRFNEDTNRKKIRKLTDAHLKKLATKNQNIPQQVKVNRNVFVRNIYVAELAKRMAKGICQDCKQPAPFINKFTNGPYLETHHIVPFSEGGEDTIENVIALCPNCHRKRHYG